MDEIAGNALVLRQINVNLVKSALKEQHSGTKSSLSLATGLSIATVGTVLSTLIKSGEVIELEPTESSGGRRARQFQFNPRSALIAALTIVHHEGVASIVYSVADLYRQDVERSTVIIGPDCIKSITALLQELFARHGSIMAIALGIPAAVRDGTPFVSDEFPQLLDFPLKSYFEDVFEVPVIVENDVNAASIGYFEQHIRDESASLAYLSFPQSSCMGGAMIIHGKLLRGFSSFAGEIDYLPIEQNSFENPRLLPSTLARIIACIACIVNPQSVVLSGTGIDSNLLSQIRSLCLNFLPKSSMPALLISDDFAGDYLSGLIHCALIELDPSVKLLVRRS